MDNILKTAVFLFISFIFIGILMKLANYIGERIGIYKMLQDLWKLIKSK